MNKWFKILNVAGQVPQIMIYGIIGDFDDVANKVTFNDFQAQFRQIESNNKECVVRINSEGGSVLEGLAIYDLMVNSKMKITTIVDGTAASMAAILAQAGNVRLITPNGFFMLHKAQGSVSGEAADIRYYADQVDALNNKIQAILVKKTGLSIGEIDNLLIANKHNWINAQDAVSKFHLADGILENENFFGEQYDAANITNSLNAGKTNWTFMDWHKNDPIGLQNLQNTNPTAWNKLYNDLAQRNKNNAHYQKDEVNVVLNQAQINALQNNNNRSGWGFMDWFKNDPKGLKTLEETNPTAWNKLYKDLEKSLVVKGHLAPLVTSSTVPRPERAGLPGNMNIPTNQAHWTYFDYAKNDPTALADLQANNSQKFNSLVNAVSQQAKSKGWIK